VTAQDIQSLVVAKVQSSEGYWASVWRRLRRDPVAMTAGAVVLALILMATAVAPGSGLSRRSVRKT